jgi:hypothetical protein
MVARDLLHEARIDAQLAGEERHDQRDQGKEHQNQYAVAENHALKRVVEGAIARRRITGRHGAPLPFRQSE